ncbi:hypothetical protein MRX96_010071 [Rhipicephalus microplus]
MGPSDGAQRPAMRERDSADPNQSPAQTKAAIPLMRRPPDIASPPLAAFTRSSRRHLAPWRVFCLPLPVAGTCYPPNHYRAVVCITRSRHDRSCRQSQRGLASHGGEARSGPATHLRPSAALETRATRMDSLFTAT